MSTYNGSQFLREQIDSILKQKNVSLKLIVRDDGSTDSTPEILNYYQERGLLRWWKADNVGPANSFFELLKQSPEAEFYAFSDQDDVWDDDKLFEAVSLLSCNAGTALYHCNSRLVDKSLCSVGRNTYKPGRSRAYSNTSLLNVLCGAAPMGCTTVFTKEIRDAVNSRSAKEFIAYHDRLIYDLCALLRLPIIYDDRPHLSYRQHGNNVIGVSGGISAANLLRYIQRGIRANPLNVYLQAASIEAIYSDILPAESLRLLRYISDARKKFLHRLMIALSPEVTFSSAFNSIYNRICLVIGNK